MKPIVLSVLLLACGLALVTCSPAQFNELIQLSTITYGLANFTNYGCHCGAGTQGLPVDAIDRCCHSHDCCYNKVEMYGCNPKVLTYRFYAQGDKIKCGKLTKCRTGELDQNSRLHEGQTGRGKVQLSRPAGLLGFSFVQCGKSAVNVCKLQLSRLW
ncbi:phospholipase A2 homolog otoconin-22-like isoform X1 [Crotalus tigris]|uniref:phospholipase A2 homolog otoconin-22-like isoform X1 n=1 Tax=Crotalus tigris TaxID=88082 RepID=UPI00192F661B|nr:phospholipase A2 homolog otoconin-22-like isoform X1 [Crotalus tigris]